MSATAELERGRLAREVLDNPVFLDAVGQIEQEIYRQWQSEENPKQREWLWSLTQAHKRLQLALRDTMQTGQLRSKQIERQQSLGERIGSRLRRD